MVTLIILTSQEIKIITQINRKNKNYEFFDHIISKTKF